MRSSSTGVGLKSNDVDRVSNDVLLRDGKGERTQRQRGEGHVETHRKTRQRLDVYQPRIASSHQREERGTEWILPQSLQKERTLLTPRF